MIGFNWIIFVSQRYAEPLLTSEYGSSPTLRTLYPSRPQELGLRSQNWGLKTNVIT